MNDYKELLNEYQILKYLIKNQLNDMTFLLDKTNSFKNGIILIEKNLKSIQGNSDDFDFINPLFNTFIQEIHKYTELYNEQISIPIQQFIESFNCTTNFSIDSFNQLKINLIDNKQKVIKAKEDYYNYIKSIKNLEEDKDDKNELLKAKKDNYAQLYKYEIDKMNEIIDQSNQKYFEIYKNLDSINFSVNTNIKDILNKFSQNISDIGNIFLKFSEQFKECMNINMKDIEKTNRYVSQVDEKTKMRFNHEKFKEYKENNNKNEEEIENKKENNNNNFKLKRILSLPSKGFCDFEIMQSPIEIMDQKNVKERISQINNFINKFPTENELSLSEVSKLMNILKEEAVGSDESFSYIFVNNLKKFLKNRLINFKNKQNFIHLSNIMNNVCLKEDNTKTFNSIVQVSQTIKYNNTYLSSIIQRKNHFFSTKTFWLRIIKENFIENINNYVDKILKKNAKPLKKSKSEKSIEIEKLFELNDKFDIIDKMGLKTIIINYEKLDNEKKIILQHYAYENICIILSKAINGMCSFFVSEDICTDIIQNYLQLFGFKEKTKLYFLNLLSAYNISNYISNKKTKENSKVNRDNNDTLLIVLSTLKYLERKDFINLIHLNKDSSPLIKKNIFKILLSNEITIEKRIKIWGKILKIEEQKNLIKYQEVKFLLNEKIEKSLIAPDSQEAKNIHTIEVDLLRTPFINSDDSHIEKLGWVLKCLNFVRPDIGYCQGMNLLGLFFYQLLDYDEEETFYYLFGLEDTTRYGKMFINDLHLMNILFAVLDKLINLYKPELHYKFVDNYITTQLYSTSWFITLFTNINCVFEKNNAPKYVLMVLENFLLDGFSAIFTSGYTIIRYYFKRISQLETEQLINFMVTELCEQDIFKNENFSEIKIYYEKNAEKINALLINKLIDISEYESENTYLKKN